MQMKFKKTAILANFYDVLYGFESHRLRHKGNPPKRSKMAVLAGFLRFWIKFIVSE